MGQPRSSSMADAWERQEAMEESLQANADA
jgi:hypothetical protein